MRSQVFFEGIDHDQAENCGNLWQFARQVV